MVRSCPCIRLRSRRVPMAWSYVPTHRVSLRLSHHVLRSYDFRFQQQGYVHLVLGSFFSGEDHGSIYGRFSVLRPLTTSSTSRPLIYASSFPTRLRLWSSYAHTSLVRPTSLALALRFLAALHCLHLQSWSYVYVSFASFPLFSLY